ncbi:MAG: tubulin-like doman-containing protein [Spirochaetales bacterium]
MKKYFPTIFIGLGGSGSKTIRFLRELCLATPEYTPLVDHQFIFSALDTDVEELRASGIPDENQIKTSENVNVARYIEDKRNANDTDFFSWWPADTGMLNTKPLDKGAGQIRITSRLGYHYQMENNNLKEKINAILTKVQGITANVDTSDNMLRIYVIASTAGGTGSALFNMIGYQVRELLKGRKVDMRAVLMMPEVFCQGGQEPSLYNRLRANGYASLKELEAAIGYADSSREYVDYIPPFNYLAQPDFQANIVENAERYLSERPFDWCVLFDKTRDSGIPFETPGPGYEHYYREIAHCLYMQVFSPIADKAGSAEDNFINSLLKAVKGGEKSRRYSSFGFSALIFPRKDIAWRLSYEYLNKTFGEEGYWLKADAGYLVANAQYEREKAEGKPVSKPRREEAFLTQVQALANQFPVPFVGIRIAIDGSPDTPNNPTTYDSYWTEVVKRIQKEYVEQVLSQSQFIEKDGTLRSQAIEAQMGTKSGVYAVLSDMKRLRKRAERFQKENLRGIVEDVFQDSGVQGQAYRLGNLLKAPGGDGSKRNLFEIRYLLSTLYKTLSIYRVLLANSVTGGSGAGKKEDSSRGLNSFEEELGKVQKRFESLNSLIEQPVLALSKKTNLNQMKELFQQFLLLPGDAAFSNYRLSSYTRFETTRQADGSLVVKNNGWSQGLHFFAILETFVGQFLDRIDPEKPQGLLNCIHGLFDKMSDLKRQVAAGLEAVKHSGKFEDKIYPDNSKITVLASEEAIQKFMQQIFKMDSNQVLAEFYNSLTDGVMKNWNSLTEKLEDFEKQALDSGDVLKRMKDESNRASKKVVGEVREGMVEAVFQKIEKHHSLDLSIGAALEEEAKMLHPESTERDIEEYKKDKAKAAFGLSAPFIRISKGDNRVNKIQSYACTSKVQQELGKVLQEYLKSAPGIFPETETDKLEESFDNRVLFYQSYLAFDLGKVENLFTGNGSMKAAYYQELRDSAITTHIHQDWSRELEDLDAYFNQQIKAFFLVWLALGRERDSKDDSTSPLLHVTEEKGTHKSSAWMSGDWKPDSLEDDLSTYSKRFASTPLKLEDKDPVNLLSVFKLFRVNFGLADGAVCQKRLELRLVENVQLREVAWQKELTGYLSVLATYLNKASTRKNKTSVFVEQLYNSTLAFAKRCDDEAAWAEGLRAACAPFEEFFWPVVS